MKIAVIGYGAQGKTAVNYWDKGNDITVCDKDTNIQLPAGIDSQLGENYLQNLDRFDLIVRSPSIHPDDIIKANNQRILRKMTSVTEEFLRVCSAPIIGVTGTKGKGTTSTLITKILEASGKKVHLGGNIGIPPLELMANQITPNDWVVLELANFQLIDCGVSPKIAVCLMVVPEHLDWHKNLEEYIHAKQNLFRYQTFDDLAIFNRANDLSGVVAEVSPALKVSYEVPEIGIDPQDKNGAYVLGEEIFMDDQKVCDVQDVILLGRHNLENVCAAIAATWDIIGNDPAVVKKVVSEFKGMPYRLELIREFNGIRFYDDSFGTTPETAIVAIKAFQEPKIIIVGGSDKGASYTDLAKTIRDTNVKAVVQIGQMGPKIAEELNKIGYSNVIDGGKDMQTIIAKATSLATSGDIVLLSTACASFDMFKNYQDRGDQFNKIVNSL